MAGREDLDRRLKATDPLPVGVVHTAATRARLDEIRVRARSGPREPESRRAGLRSSIVRRATRRGVMIASAIGVLAVGGAAAAASILAGTDTIGAPGYCQSIIDNTSSIPFPPGYQSWRNWTLLMSGSTKAGTTLHEECNDPTQRYVAKAPGGGTYHTSLLGAQLGFTKVAFCAWTDQWVKAEESGDTATASNDATEISGALQWPLSQQLDPDAADHVVGPAPVGPFSPGRELGWFIPIQKAVQAGEVDQVKELFNYYATGATNPFPMACWGYKPPADSDNGTVLPDDYTAADMNGV